MFESDSTPCRDQTEPARWERTSSTAAVVAFEATTPRDISQRQFAQAHGVPRATLQHWLARKATIDADPAVVAFFESPVGLAFLHRLVVATQLVFTQVGPCGIRLVCQFLALSTLDRFVAASYGAQQQVAHKMQAELSVFAAQEQPRLAHTMVPKKITVCEDETYHPEICLVAIEPVSDFILVEQYAAQRDAETWNQALEQALTGLPVAVIQSTSDEAQGILAHVRAGLGAHHSPDLFHGQHELHKASSLPLQAQIAQARQQVEQAEKHTRRAEQERQIFLTQPPRPGFPPDFPQRIAHAKQAEAEARQALETAQTRRDQMQEAIQGLSAAYHPYDLSNAQVLPAAEVERRLEAHFAQIDQVAEAAELSEGSRSRIEKARRLLKSLVATVAFFHLQVQLWVSQLALAPEVERVVLNEWIPALYLERAAQKLPTAAARAPVATISEPLLTRIRAPAGVLSTLPTEERAKIEGVAQACADLFQRSSSCVEGRNGQLALRHHSLHRLTKGKRAALTVVHNYYVTRSDGTTAAERFFGSKPADLFGWLVDHLEVPARPAAKRPKTARKAA
jgi:hypothetical protein